MEKSIEPSEEDINELLDAHKEEHGILIDDLILYGSVIYVGRP